MNNKVYNVLILCTGNSARSILAEAILNTVGRGRFHAYSAGSHPTGQVNYFALEKLASINYPIDTLRSKSWDEFTAPTAPEMDFIITVCSNAAGEACPIWQGSPIKTHWEFEDPAAVDGEYEMKRRAFNQTFDLMMKRIQLFVDLPFSSLDPAATQTALAHIAEVGSEK